MATWFCFHVKLAELARMHTFCLAVFCRLILWRCNTILTYLSGQCYRYKRKNKEQLQKMLYDCNEQLQQFSHVNKKALDQYVNFTEQREQLQRRRAELDAGDQVKFSIG
jgi:chromosome segregation ATPase